MSYDNKDRGQVEMYDAVCVKCKKATQVPFKPTGDKGVKCRDCFLADRPNGEGNGRGSDRKFSDKRGGNSRRGISTSADLKKIQAQIDAVHQKLDLIMKSMSINHTISNTVSEYLPKKMNSKKEAPKDGELKNLLEKVTDKEK